MDADHGKGIHRNTLCTKGAKELAAMIRSGEVSSIEVIDACLARIEAVNPDVNAVTVKLTEEARVNAVAVDRAIASGLQLGSLAGVPFTVKENIDLAGSATTWGVTALAEQIASTDAPIVLSPVCCGRPWRIDEDVSRIAEIGVAMRMVVPINIPGLPSCAVPVGCDDGLPQGVQLIGARLREDLLLDAAQALEDRAPVITPIDPRVA